MPSISQAHQKFRSVPTELIPTGNGTMLAYSRLSHLTTILNVRLASLLQKCSEFKSLDEHTSFLNSSGVRCQREDLLYLHEKNLLVCDEEIMQLCSVETFPKTDHVPISWLAIPTCNRLNELGRALRSYTGYIRQYREKIRVLVVDDARETSCSEEACNITKQIGEQSNCRIQYYGYSDKVRFIDSLCRAGGFCPDVVNFGLLGKGYICPTMGANRNWILLLTSGANVLTVDDDTICRPGSAPGADTERLLIRGSGASPWEIWSYSGREDCFGAFHSSDIDILAEHERTLGRPLSEVLGDALKIDSTHIGLESPCDHFISDIMQRSGSVRITLNGAVGDSGMHSGLSLLRHKDPATRNRLLRSKETFQQALLSRDLIRQAPATVVQHHGLFCSMFMGLDNKKYLPPFFPVYRNEDGIFGACLSRCAPDAYVCHLPFALLHDPNSSRTNASGTMTTVRVSDTIIACLASYSADNVPCDFGRLCANLGNKLIELASRSEQKFLVELRRILIQRIRTILEENAALLSTFDNRPDYWAIELMSETHKLRRSVFLNNYLIPTDLVPQFGQQKALVALQGLLLKFGKFLRCWPDIVECARSIVSQAVN